MWKIKPFIIFASGIMILYFVSPSPAMSSVYVRWVPNSQFLTCCRMSNYSLLETLTLIWNHPAITNWYDIIHGLKLSNITDSLTWPNLLRRRDPTQIQSRIGLLESKMFLNTENNWSWMVTPHHSKLYYWSSIGFFNPVVIPAKAHGRIWPQWIHYEKVNHVVEVKLQVLGLLYATLWQPFGNLGAWEPWGRWELNVKFMWLGAWAPWPAHYNLWCHGMIVIILASLLRYII